MFIKRLTVLLCAGLLSAGTIAVAASPAQAEPAATHCMIVLPGPSPVRCFANEDEARRFAEQNATVIPGKGETAPGFAASTSRASVAAGLTLIGKEYAGLVYTGDVMWVYGSGGPCTTPTTNVDYEVPDWAVYGFDQRISSFKTYGNCYAKHYDLVGFGGFSVGYQGSQAVIALGIDNDTSSERWS